MGDPVPKQTLIEDLQELSEELGRTARARDMDERGKHSASMYQRRFGSWSAAKEAAELPPSEIQKRISDEELLSELQRVADNLGRTPKLSDLDEYGKYSRGPYQVRFGSWNEALEAANLDLNRPTDIPKSDLIAELTRLADELGRTPTREDMTTSGKYGASTCQRTFGSWTAAIEVAGLPPAEMGNRYSDEELLNELRRLADAHRGKPPTTEEMNKEGRYSHRIYNIRFGSWRAALEAAGLELPLRYEEVSEADLIDDIQHVGTLVGGTPRFADIKELGEYQPDWYRRAFGTWNNAVEAAGFEPNVQRNVDPEEMLAELNRLGGELGRTPRQVDMAKEGRFSPSTYQDQFGSWNNALREAGLQPTKRQGIDEDDLLSELNRLSNELGRSPTTGDMDELGEFSTPPYFDRFGSWYAALEAAGLEAPLRFEDVSRDQLISEVHRLAQLRNEAPQIFDVRDHSPYRPRWFYREFGSWQATLEAAGFKPNRFTDVSDAELLAEIERLADGSDEGPTRAEMDNDGRFPASHIARRFGSWNEAIREAGLEPAKRTQITDEELEDEFHRLKEALGHVPSGVEMDELGTFSKGVYDLRFGTWNKAVEAFGEEPRYTRFGEGDDVGYGSLWETRRAEIIERDDEECVVCGCQRDEHQKQYRKDLHVHHIHRFIDEYDRTGSYEIAHRSENLVTVCVSCHYYVEGKPPEYFEQFR